MRKWLLLNLNFRRKWRSSSLLQLSPQRYTDLKPELLQVIPLDWCQLKQQVCLKSDCPWWCSNSNVVYDASIPQQDTAVNGAVSGPVMTVDDVVKTATAVSHTPSVSQSKANEPPELLTNEIIEEKGKRHGWPGGSVYLNFTYLYIFFYQTWVTNVHSHFPCFLPCYFTGPDAPADLSPAKDFSEPESQSSPSAAAVKQDILPPPVGAVTTDEGEEETSKLVKNNLTDDKDMELMDVHEDGTQTEGKELTLLCFGKSNPFNTCILVFSHLIGYCWFEV